MYKDNENLAKMPTILDVISQVTNEENTLKIAYKQKPAITIENWMDFVNSFRISQERIYDVPPHCIQIKSRGEYISFGSLGNFSVITGKAKSRKIKRWQKPLSQYQAAAAVKKSIPKEKSHRKLRVKDHRF